MVRRTIAGSFVSERHPAANGHRDSLERRRRTATDDAMTLDYAIALLHDGLTIEPSNEPTK